MRFIQEKRIEKRQECNEPVVKCVSDLLASGDANHGWVETQIMIGWRYKSWSGGENVILKTGCGDTEPMIGWRYGINDWVERTVIWVS